MMGKKATRVLYVEDDRVLALLFKRMLEKRGFVVDVAPDGESGLQKVRHESCDVLVVDYNLPRHNGLEVIRLLAVENHLPPTIMLTATGNEQIAVEAMKWGASDYLVKEENYLELLPAVIQQILHEQQLEAEKQAAEEALRRSEETNRALLNAIPDIMLQVDAGGNIVDSRFSAAAAAPFTGEPNGRNVSECLPPQAAAAFIEHLHAALAGHKVEHYEFEVQQDDTVHYFENRLVTCGEGKVLSILRDVTARVKGAREREALIAELQEAASRIKTLRGLIPICSSCKKIRDDGGYWNQLEQYIQKHSEAEFSHSYCPQCIQKHFPEQYVEGKYR